MVCSEKKWYGRTAYFLTCSDIFWWRYLRLCLFQSAWGKDLGEGGGGLRQKVCAPPPTPSTSLFLGVLVVVGEEEGFFFQEFVDDIACHTRIDHENLGVAEASFGQGACFTEGGLHEVIPF